MAIIGSSFLAHGGFRFLKDALGVFHVDHDSYVGIANNDVACFSVKPLRSTY